MLIVGGCKGSRCILSTDINLRSILQHGVSQDVQRNLRIFQQVTEINADNAAINKPKPIVSIINVFEIFFKRLFFF
jgi:hypothetical protein